MDLDRQSCRLRQGGRLTDRSTRVVGDYVPDLFSLSMTSPHCKPAAPPRGCYPGLPSHRPAWPQDVAITDVARAALARGSPRWPAPLGSRRPPWAGRGYPAAPQPRGPAPAGLEAGKARGPPALSGQPVQFNPFYPAGLRPGPRAGSAWGPPEKGYSLGVTFHPSSLP